MTESSRGTSSPESGSHTRGDGRPLWPQRFRPAMLIGSVATSALAILGIRTVGESWRIEDPLVTAGYCGGSLLMTMIALGLLREAGFRYLGLSGKIRPIRNPSHGNGVSIPTTRILIPFLIISLIAGACYGATASVGWFIGAEESLLPNGRDSRADAVYMATLAALASTLALFLASIRIKTVVSIYSGGIERYSHRRILLSNKVSRIFVRWQDITLVDGRIIDSFQNPGIDIHTSPQIEREERTPHDEEHKIALMAHVLVTEPNTLFALLKRLHENPDDRALVHEADAVELLRPPTLRQRFRAARGRKAQA